MIIWEKETQVFRIIWGEESTGMGLQDGAEAQGSVLRRSSLSWRK